MNRIVDVSREHPELGSEVYKIGNTFIIVKRQGQHVTADLSNRHRRIRGEELDLVIAKFFSDFDHCLLNLDKQRRHIVISSQ